MIELNKAADSNGRPRAKLRVLVVDPYEECLHSMSILVRLCGHQVLEARSAEEAIQISADHWPDVVTLEIDLPGLSGYELAEHFSQITEDPKKKPLLIAVTSYGSDQDRQVSTEKGIHWHLLKPVDPNELEAVFEQCTQRKTLSQT